MAPEFNTLVPGYVQVDAFGPDEDYESDSEEVSYVTFDLGQVDPSLVPRSTTYRLIGLDTPTPFLQLSGTIFKGRHDRLLGSELFFAHARYDGPSSSDPARRHVIHHATTRQRVRFRQVELKPKGSIRPMQTQVSTNNGTGDETMQGGDGFVFENGEGMDRGPDRGRRGGGRARTGRGRGRGRGAGRARGKGKGKATSTWSAEDRELDGQVPSGSGPASRLAELPDYGEGLYVMGDPGGGELMEGIE